VGTGPSKQQAAQIAAREALTRIEAAAVDALHPTGDASSLVPE
jgi:hypothetical protein